MIKELTIASTNNTGFKSFTNENLQQLAASCEGSPVLLGFDIEEPVGEVYSAEVVNGKLVVEAYIGDNYKWILKNMYAVVGYRMPDHRLESVGIVFEPEDKSLLRITYD